MRRPAAGAPVAAALAAVTLALVACGKLQGVGGAEPPFASFPVTFTGDLSTLPPDRAAPHATRVALVWGAQWFTEPFCFLPPESEAAAAVIAAGCRDPFGFVPARVDVSAPIELGVPTALSLFNLPPADVLVGGITSRIAYGSLVVFDDRNDSGTLELSRPRRTRTGGFDQEITPDVGDASDVVLGASFITMTAPDQRVAYREGTFNAMSAFYPRAGCPAGAEPPRGFSVVGAGGFPAAGAIAAALAGQLPQEDPSTCTAGPPTAVSIPIPARAGSDVDEVGCDERTDDGSSRYRQPPVNAPDLANRASACVHLPSFDTSGAPAASSIVQLVVSGRPTDRCKGLRHYTLRGCFDDVACALPEWDFTANPPDWWPCP